MFCFGALALGAVVVVLVVVVLVVVCVLVVAGALAGLSVDEVTGVETVVTLDVGEAVTVLVAAAAGEDTTLVGFSGLMGLTGD